MSKQQFKDKKSDNFFACDKYYDYQLRKAGRKFGHQVLT